MILSPIEQSIKNKIEAVGTPLKDWNIQIYRGVLTGYNDAFIIDTEKRNTILDKCDPDNGERQRTEELIRPILRGRDIKRYSYDWANLWLICTHNGIKGKTPRVDIEDYPAVKAHLDQYWDKISKRADKGDTPYNLRNCAYWNDFSKPKIIWGEISYGSKFTYEPKGEFLVEATSFLMSGKELEYLVCALNSPLTEWFFSTVSTLLGERTLRWKKYTIGQILIPRMGSHNLQFFRELVSDWQHNKISTQELNNRANNCIYKSVNLTDEEIEFIEAFRKESKMN